MRRILNRRIVQFAAALWILVFSGACQHAKFRSEEATAMPWATPEGFENSGAGTPFGLMEGLQGR